MQQLPLDWKILDIFCGEILKINKKKEFTGVYGLPRGGLIPAVVISNRLNIPMLAAPTDGCLIVDDIADTGRSLEHYTINETQKNKYFIATLCYKSKSKVKPDYFTMNVADYNWVVFPWESEGE